MKRHWLIGIFLFTALGLNAQSDRLTDFEIWLRLSARADLSEKFRIGLEEQIRFDEQASELKNYFTELNLAYKLNANFSLLGRFRYTSRNDNSGKIQGIEKYMRYQLGLRFKHEKGQFRLNHRLLFQRSEQLELSFAQGDIPLQFLRYRFKNTYKIKNWKYDPYLTAEYFQPLNNLDDLPKAIRLGLGTERSYDKIGTFGIRYQYEWTIAYEFPRANHILAFSYLYKF